MCRNCNAVMISIAISNRRVNEGIENRFSLFVCKMCPRIHAWPARIPVQTISAHLVVLPSRLRRVVQCSGAGTETVPTRSKSAHMRYRDQWYHSIQMVPTKFTIYIILAEKLTSCSRWKVFLAAFSCSSVWPITILGSINLIANNVSGYRSSLPA